MLIKKQLQTITFLLLCMSLLVGFNLVQATQHSLINQESKQDHLLKEKQIESSGSIFAGASIRDITPDLDVYDSIYLAGFDRNRIATGIHDTIWSRCCCIRIGTATIAFVSVDLIGIMYHEYLSIINAFPDDISIDHVILTSTHNHEGPDVIGLWGSGFKSGITWNWYTDALSKITDSIIDAYRSMEPAGIKFGHEMAPGFSRDSRNPKIMEEQVETIQVISQDSEIISTLVCYASHPEVLWSKNTLITSDYAHYLYEYIKQQTDGIGILLTGPIGGLITPNVSNHTFHAAQLFGEQIAHLSLSSLNDEIIWNTNISVKIKELFIPMTNPLFRFASFFNILERPLYHFNRYLLTAVSVIELGENGSLAQIITVPGEDFPENWFEIKEKLHSHHRIHIGLCMDELGYIVPFEDFDRTDYEESMSASKFLDPLVHSAIEGLLDNQ